MCKIRLEIFSISSVIKEADFLLKSLHSASVPTRFRVLLPVQPLNNRSSSVFQNFSFPISVLLLSWAVHQPLLLPCQRSVSCYVSRYILPFFYFWRNSPHWARASSFTRFLDHTQWRTTVRKTPLDEWSARRLIPDNTTTFTTDRLPCPRWDSNPHSQQASGHRPTQTARPLGSAFYWGADKSLARPGRKQATVTKL